MYKCYINVKKKTNRETYQCQQLNVTENISIAFSTPRENVVTIRIILQSLVKEKKRKL